MATWNMLSFQDAASPIMEHLIMFHDHTMMILIMITMTVLYMLLSLKFNKFINRFLLEGQMIELIWTIMPALLLVVIALPSLKILYLLEEINKPLITLKAIGHQWYWSYEYSDFKKIEFDSYMKKPNMNENDEYRLIEVDNRIMLPYNTKSRILVTSFDVIHSWTIPSLGIKIDGTPGRMNQGSILINRPGLFYGQCSEICGANHSFMPILLQSVSLNSFINWIKNF
uniref:cytochrome c oxidase subunit II n=1 Tax=Doratura stylata TaxID=139543 RepID=UPI002027E3A6|nr:cytochrome c oxidase subunit II [Doratura stylata]UPU95798.1 cytochrome c oxidase subunit II [Doratura stylata]UXD78641.1 cytochrome c oxidase subunit II [Doratura stylata]